MNTKKIIKEAKDGIITVSQFHTNNIGLKKAIYIALTKKINPHGIIIIQQYCMDEAVNYIYNNQNEFNIVIL